MVVVGLDEAGVGPAFGSLWASAVHLPEDVTIRGLTDSKRLTETRRIRIRTELLVACQYGLGEVTSHEIDTLGLAECRRLVFERALDHFFEKYPSVTIDKLVVDGTLFRPYREIPYECLPKADLTVSHVSAASILAKTTRDEQVIALCDQDSTLHDRYGIRRNKGYLTPEHIKGLHVHGATSHHRRSYKVPALPFER